MKRTFILVSALISFATACGTERVEYNDASIRQNAGSVEVSGAGSESGTFATASIQDAQGTEMQVSSEVSASAAIKCDKCVCDLNTNICTCTGCVIDL